MAKISTYPNDSNVTGGDRLIGTDVDNSNATKNFTVSDLGSYIISQAATNNLVPYTGATQSVDLGSYDLSLGSLTINNGMSLTGELFTLGSAGNAGYMLISNGSGLSPHWVDGSLTYVPYTGATSDVNLGAHNLYAYDGFFNGTFESVGQAFFDSDVFLSDAGSDLENQGTLTQIGSASFASSVYLQNEVLDGTNSAGAAGAFLTSQGAGLPTVWTTPSYPHDSFASFYSTQTQTMTLSDGPTPWTYNNTDIVGDSSIIINNNGIGNPTRITMGINGTYNIQFSAQLSKTSGGDNKASIWLRKNGVDVAYSNTHVTMKANANYVVASWNFFVTATVGNYFEIMWVQDGGISLLYEAPDLVTPHPATPSIILTVNRMS